MKPTAPQIRAKWRAHYTLMEWATPPILIICCTSGTQTDEKVGESFHQTDYWADQIPYKPLHVHLGDLKRFSPRAEDPMMQGFFDRIRELGYDGRCSFECKLPEGGATEALEHLRQLSS